MAKANEKPAPEVIGDWIHVRVRNPNLFKEGSYRTFDISKSKGIKSVAGKLKKPPAGQEGSLVVQKYLFDKKKWTVREAAAWVKDNGKSIEEITEEEFMEPQNKTIRIEGTKETPVIKEFDLTDLKVTKENNLVIIRGYANTKGNKDRYGDVPTVFPEKRNFVYELTEFRKNPVMLLDHSNSVSAIAGSFPEVVEDDIGLRVTAVFSNSDLPAIKHARTVYLEGHAKAFSIAGRWSYEDTEHQDHLTLAEIWHISPVGVGADPNALGAGDEINPPKKDAEPPPAPEMTEAEKEWHDDISEEFPHHRASDNGAELFHVKASMACLLGAEGKVEVSGAEKKKIYLHLAEHYKELKETPPDFKSIAIKEADDEIIFLTFEEAVTRDIVSMRDVLKQAVAQAGLKDGIEELKQLLEKNKREATNT